MAVEDGLKIGDARPLVADANHEALRGRGGVQREFGAAAARIAEGIARQFGNRGGDPGLVLAIESQQFRHAVSALADSDDIALVLDRHGHDRPGF